MLQFILTYSRQAGWIFLLLLLVNGCNEDRPSSADLYEVPVELRSKINTGIENICEEHFTLFSLYLEELEKTCNSPQLSKTTSCETYMNTEAYQQFKGFIIENAPETYYLLIDLFLRGDRKIGPFNMMFHDLVEASYPGTIQKVLDRLEHKTTDRFLKYYPEVCVEHLLRVME